MAAEPLPIAHLSNKAYIRDLTSNIFTAIAVSISVDTVWVTAPDTPDLVSDFNTFSDFLFLFAFPLCTAGFASADVLAHTEELLCHCWELYSVSLLGFLS